MRQLDLQRIRKEYNATQKFIAEETGYPQGFVSVIESGKASAPKPFIEKVRALFNIENIDDYISYVLKNDPTQKSKKKADKKVDNEPIVSDEETDELKEMITPQPGAAEKSSGIETMVNSFLEIIKKKEERIEKLESENEQLRNELLVALRGTCK